VVITDTPTTIDRLEKILTRIDVLPKQILIEARIMEVSRDLLRDLGIDVGTGQAGVETATALPTQLTLGEQNSESSGPTAVSDIGAQVLGTAVAPSIFGPKSTISGVGAALTMGLELVFRKLNEPQFQVILRALEEDIRTNTLSAPHIVTLSGQEARILVGTKYPIITRTVSGGDSPQTTESLERYQDIGIELFVVPQIGGDRHIDLIVHPVVSSRTGTVGTNAYPILDVRETETQIIMVHGETIVIGGLLKDVKARSKIGLPFLGKLPLVGPIFQRTTTDVEKIDLLIFITAKLVEPGALSQEQQEDLRESYESFLRERYPKKSKRNKVRLPPEADRPAEPVDQPENRGTLYRKR
jgi:type II secretory pathway component GspD/PulD (secretin)